MPRARPGAEVSSIYGRVVPTIQGLEVAADLTTSSRPAVDTGRHVDQWWTRDTVINGVNDARRPCGARVQHGKTRKEPILERLEVRDLIGRYVMKTHIAFCTLWHMLQVSQACIELHATDMLNLRILGHDDCWHEMTYISQIGSAEGTSEHQAQARSSLDWIQVIMYCHCCYYGYHSHMLPRQQVPALPAGSFVSTS